MTTAFSQLSPHGGRRTSLPGRYGPVAALTGPEPADPLATVLLLPGYTGSKEDFAPLLDRLADAGFLPVAVDLPGQYESPGPDDESLYLPATLGEVAAELIGALAADDLPVLVLGHSYGGLVARGAVLAGAQVAGLTLLSSGPEKLPQGFRLTALAVGDPLLRDHGVEAAYTLREEVSAHSPAWAALAEELREFLRTRFVLSSAAGLLGMSAGLRTEPDLVDELAAVLRERETPSIVVAGERDDAWSLDQQKDMARRLGAPFAVVENAAHSPNTENPPALLEILVNEWRSWLAP
ncbi:alpha/beta hydrolase [Saccharomonospora sp. NPDC046836]|uniref:alpha/beta fold hydrolase n=1 Tax=Saccharomonospora sp. NPDC046836 TaxID=3156921 RepID=UPI0033DCDF8A